MRVSVSSLFRWRIKNEGGRRVIERAVGRKEEGEKGTAMMHSITTNTETHKWHVYMLNTKNCGTYILIDKVVAMHLCTSMQIFKMPVVACVRTYMYIATSPPSPNV